MKGIGCSHQKEDFQGYMSHEKDMVLKLIVPGHVN